MEEDIKHLRGLVQQLQGDLEEARSVARRLHSDGEKVVEGIDDGQALEARGDLQAALEQAAETIDTWPETA